MLDLADLKDDRLTRAPRQHRLMESKRVRTVVDVLTKLL